MARKKVDMSEAYDYMRNLKDSYVLCFDIQGLMILNNISNKLGDLAILEQASRIDKAASDDMLLIRIGGDEFALLTGLYEEEKAEALMKEVLEKNGEPIVYEGKEYPLSLWCGITKIPQKLRYSELFTDLHNAIERSKS